MPFGGSERSGGGFWLLTHPQRRLWFFWAQSAGVQDGRSHGLFTFTASKLPFCAEGQLVCSINTS